MKDQQRLFDHYNPVEERMAAYFFEDLPTDSGVYKMYGSQGQLLYVGKAKNLRNRLFTYRRAKMETTRRKIVRLIRMTYQIEVETTVNEKEALLLENKLIRKHRPEFNHAKKQPETYYFAGIERQKNAVQFSLQMHQPETEFIYGAFKGHRVIRKSLGGLIRMLYMLEHEVSNAFDLPSVLTRKLTPLKYKLQVDAGSPLVESLWPAMQAYFKGQNMDLLEQIMQKCEERDLLQTFAGSMILDDMEAMKWFYERCSHRNYQIRKQLDLDNHIIPQKKLDDYLIEWAFAEEE